MLVTDSGEDMKIVSKKFVKDRKLQINSRYCNFSGGRSPCPLRLLLTPTYLQSRQVLGIEDFRLKSCMGIQYMRIKLKHFQ
jgi:hypothetical protein